MKRQIRRSVWETNSSSVHSLVMTSREEYDKWEDDKVIYIGNGREYEEGKAPVYGKCYTIDEAIDMYNAYSKYGKEYPIDKNSEEEEFLEELRYKNFVSSKWYNDCEYETFYEEYTTPGGEKVVAFGYYGSDY